VIRFNLMRCRFFLITLLFAASLRGDEPPNVVIFLTDDQGWGDLSVNGNTNLSTPNIDSLARDGATFENFYVCAVCAPTRAEFLTGRYHLRTGVTGVSEGEGRLNPEETTLANLFQKSGYTTGAFGKWHNGTQSPYHPNDRGFDEFYGFTSGHWGHYFSPPLDHNGTKVRGEGYVVDDFTNKAISFIEENQEKPFFCYLPYNTPHSPMMVDDDYYAKFKDVDPKLKHRDPEKEDIMVTRAALAMCENIDWNVGRVLQTLDALNLADDTIVIYFSDNGPNSYRWNGSMKGKKGSVDEGGLRSPFFLRWPGKVTAGSTEKQITGAIDLLPTLAKLTGIESRTTYPVDGHSFADKLGSDRSSSDHARPLFSSWRKRHTVRS
jgi:arylsulfatase A-like enzyme